VPHRERDHEGSVGPGRRDLGERRADRQDDQLTARPVARTDSIERGRAAFARRAWGDAHRELLAADRQAPLEPEDLVSLAIASEMLGRDEDCSEAWTRAHNEYLRLGNVPGAARCAIWLGMSLLDRGEMAPGGGWLARA